MAGAEPASAVICVSFLPRPGSHLCIPTARAQPSRRLVVVRVVVGCEVCVEVCVCEHAGGAGGCENVVPAYKGGGFGECRRASRVDADSEGPGEQARVLFCAEAGVDV